MDFFGISSAKLILIFIIAIILLGPDQVPVIVKTVGKTIRDFRRFVNETTKEFNDVTGDLRKEFTDTVGDLRTEIASTQAELKSQFDFSEVMSPITDAMRDPLGTLTTPAAQATPEPVPVLAGATAVNESNPLATQTVPYTPPQPTAAFAIPEPEVSAPAFDFSALSATAPEPITVQTPYAESLASATNGIGNDAAQLNGNGAAPMPFTSPRATKADPFADLTVLAPARPAPAAAFTVSEPIVPEATTDAVVPLTSFALAPNDAPEPEAGLAAIPVVTEPALPEPVSIAPAPVPITARREAIGRSVAGTKYGRKRAS